MDSKEFSYIRTTIGDSQKQLAKVLTVSLKMIQNYEQGLRDIPSSIERLMLLLLATNNPQRKSSPCWEIKDCPVEQRENCIIWELQTTRYCWFINGTCCQGQEQGSWEKKIKICRDCEVFTEMFQSYI